MMCTSVPEVWGIISFPEVSFLGRVPPARVFMRIATFMKLTKAHQKALRKVSVSVLQEFAKSLARELCRAVFGDFLGR